MAVTYKVYFVGTRGGGGFLHGGAYGDYGTHPDPKEGMDFPNKKAAQHAAETCAKSWRTDADRFTLFRNV